jgi:hypothetical protein
LFQAIKAVSFFATLRETRCCSVVPLREEPPVPAHEKPQDADEQEGNAQKAI